MTELYLVRHGETDWNRQHRIQGLTDIPLNATGRKQARAAGKLLARRTWNGIYSSPLSRATRDGDRSSPAQTGLAEPDAVDALVERNYGEAEGLELHRDRPPLPEPRRRCPARSPATR